MNETAFNQSQFDSIYPEGIEKHYWNSARNQIIYHWIIRHSGKNWRMLEIGCGRGIVVEYLINHGLNCFGVDIAPVVPVSSVDAFIKTGMDHTAMDPTFRQSIDTVFLFDVIEHVSDEVGFINSIRSSFPNLKRIITTVPARMELWSNYDEYNGHFRRYYIDTLKQLANKISASLTYSSYLFHSLYLPARLLLAWSKKRDTRILAPHGWRIFLHKLLAGFFLIDFLFIPPQIPGTSILCCFDFI